MQKNVQKTKNIFHKLLVGYLLLLYKVKFMRKYNTPLLRRDDHGVVRDACLYKFVPN